MLNLPAVIRSALLRVILFLLVLAVFALRVFHLATQSLWYDEAFSVYLAQMPLGEITARTAADIQPPLYYYLLHFWMLFAGSSEFAVRFLSLAFGMLTVPLLYVVVLFSIVFAYSTVKDSNYRIKATFPPSIER